MSKLKVINPGAVSPFGEANPQRGVGYNQVAIEFAHRFPISSVLTVEQLDDFAIKSGFLIAPASTDKQSDGWKAFLQRRSEFRNNLNRAASHPRLWENGVEPYSLQYVGQTLEVQTPFKAAIQSRISTKVMSVLETRRKAVRYLLQSVDYAVLPPETQVGLSMYAQTLDDFEFTVDSQSNLLNRNFSKLRNAILAGVESGMIVPKNGGIRALLEVDAAPHGDLFADSESANT
jgi:hypothetical protein